MLLRRAVVIDNDDTQFDNNKLSRIKVRVLPEMKDVKNQDLPWIEPFMNSIGVSTDTREHRVPDIDSQVFVLVMDTSWQTIRYLSGFYINGFAAYTKWETDISSEISDISSQTYPQPNEFKIYKDGSAYFRNTDTGEFGYYNSNGTYTVFDTDGNYIVYGKDKSIRTYNDKTIFEIKDTGEVSIDVDSKADITIDANGELTIDTKTQDFTIKNNSNTIVGSATGLTLNNHVEISV